MITYLCRIILATIALITFISTASFAISVGTTLEVRMEFPGGFDVSINGGPLTPSGPITVVGLLEANTPDAHGSASRGEYPLSSVTFTGAGFVNRPIVTPLNFVAFSRFEFEFEKRGIDHASQLGWQDFNTTQPYIADVNDLSTLVPLPYVRHGMKTFWYQALGANAWNLGGDTIGANLGGNGPAGIFTISIPEPSAKLLIITGLPFLSARRQRMKAIGRERK
jgi:hypothetical protein